MLALIITLYCITWFLTAMIDDEYQGVLYNWSTKQDVCISLLKIIFAPFIFIPWGLYEIFRGIVDGWASLPDNRNDDK